VDELNAHLGVVLAHAPSETTRQILSPLQKKLFTLGTDLATTLGTRDVVRITSEDVLALEASLDSLSEELPPLKEFILPSGTPAATHLHVARTVARRAERETLAAAVAHPVNPSALIFLNRLSDLLFVLCRYENHTAHTTTPGR
jgi:cob(I)alamin adenosyltransferase